MESKDSINSFLNKEKAKNNKGILDNKDYLKGYKNEILEDEKEKEKINYINDNSEKR